MLQLLTGDQEELFSTSKQGDPLITRVSTDMFALVQDKKSILISTDKSHGHEMQFVCWNEIPTALGLISKEHYFSH
jgi:hypothetical protein